MRNKKHRLLFIPIFVLFVFSGCGRHVVVMPSELASAQSAFDDGDSIEVTIGDRSWCAEVVQSDTAKSKGLSGKASLGENSGMIFAFPEASRQSFWMKDMKFDIDILWIRDDRVVDVSREVPHPETTFDDKDLPRYTPKTSANIVLEVTAGEAASIEAGDTVTYESPCEETLSS